MGAVPPIATTITSTARIQATTPFAGTTGNYTVDYDGARDPAGRVFLTHLIPGDGRSGAPNQRIVMTWADLIQLQAAVNDLISKVTAQTPAGQTP